MPIICWGNLAKSADETTRIEQAISEYVEGHDENPNAHMGEDYALGAHRLQTMLDHPYSSIYPFHIYALDAGSIKTGALVVEGGGPYIAVHGPGAEERVKIYPEGIIVRSGKVAILDEDEALVLDAKGLVSTTQFHFDSVAADEEIYIYDTNWVDMGSMVLNLTLSRQTKLLILAYASVQQLNATVNGYIVGVIDIDGTPLGDGVYVGSAVEVDEVKAHCISLHSLQTLEAGNHTIKIKWRTTDAEIPAYATERRLTYLLLGQ